MLREALGWIAEEYPRERLLPFPSNALADFIRRDAAAAVQQATGSDYFLSKGSCGQSKWADIPWLAVFDPLVTTTATRGYYVVYLYSADSTAAYLCLGQGTTAVAKEFGARAPKELLRRSALIQDRLFDCPEYISRSGVTLGGHTDLAKSYEPAVALSLHYDTAALPPEEVLVEDLQLFCRLYLMLTARGGLETISDDLGSAEDDDLPLIELKRYRRHRKIERNPRAAERAKAVHGYVCQGCAFDFGTAYGELGRNYIEAHHLVPISDLPEGVPVALDPVSDFAVLCANCHRMMHRQGSPTTIDALRMLLKAN